jgi:hypothetical protein
VLRRGSSLARDKVAQRERDDPSRRGESEQCADHAWVPSTPTRSIGPRSSSDPSDPSGPIVVLKRTQVERFASAYLLRTTANADQRQMSTRDKFSAAKTAAGRY